MLSDPELPSGCDFRLPWPWRKDAGEWSTGGSISVAQVVLACVVARRCTRRDASQADCRRSRSPTPANSAPGLVVACELGAFFFSFTEIIMT